MSLANELLEELDIEEQKQYKKIDIYKRNGKNLEYLASTTWSKTVREAVKNYAEKNQMDIKQLKGAFA